MDKRVFLWAGAIVLGLLVLSKTQLVNTFFAFFILGIIPGTPFVVPSWVIIGLYPALFLALVYWLASHTLYIGESARLTAPKKPTPSHSKRKIVKAAAKIPASKRRPRTAV